ncbi:MAG: EAL domain-containing protein [Polyangiaceae bacterium]|jgi:EAL domain-containing protein (putative c-di-GMP-specific phosphodiesterase class I)/CheY-like chemotaxis protein|nr:EAL domain-containing protein [Polyangiaceae bacterium]
MMIGESNDRIPTDPVSLTDWVLVVDDEPGVRKILARQLGKMGYRVQEAGSGLEAKRALGDKDYAAIVSDISMPDMDGMQFLRAVRERDYDVPVILVTGNPSFESAVKAIEYGAFHYFTKPFDHDEFRDVLTRAVRLRRIAGYKRRAQALLGTADKSAGDMAGVSASLDRAMDTLWTAYQPLLFAKDRSVYGHEALMRSDEPSLPHPGAVLDAAERLDRLYELGRLVRRRAAEHCSKSPESGVLFVNLHPRDLMDSMLASPDCPLIGMANRVVLEITERASLKNLDDVRARVASLRQLGFRTAVDDLGAGYAGLTSLATLQPDIVKIDMTLIRDVDKDPLKRSLVKSITSACQEMGVLVVAEGIETAEERDAIVDIGCDLLQGYRFAKPGRPFPTPTW